MWQDVKINYSLGDLYSVYDDFCWFIFSMGGAKCEKARHWSIPVVSIKWLTDVILGDLSGLKLPVNLCYANVTGNESFSVDLKKVFHLLGMPNNLHFSWSCC